MNDMVATPLPEQLSLSFVTGWTGHISESCPSHDHTAFEIVYHPGNRGWTTLRDGTRLDFGTGDTVVYAPYVAHDQGITHSGEECYLQLATSDPLPRALHGAAWRIPGPLPAWMVAELRALSNSQGDATPLARRVLDLRATAVLLHLLQGAEAAARPLAAGQRLAAAAERYLQEHYRTLGTMAEVAAALAVSHDHLRHVFLRHTGRSLVHCLLEVRIARARDLLAHSTLSLAAIADQCGFATARYLSTVFRRLTGVTPGEFRRRT